MKKTNDKLSSRCLSPGPICGGNLRGRLMGPGNESRDDNEFVVGLI